MRKSTFIVFLIAGIFVYEVPASAYDSNTGTVDADCNGIKEEDQCLDYKDGEVQTIELIQVLNIKEHESMFDSLKSNPLKLDITGKIWGSDVTQFLYFSARTDAENENIKACETLIRERKPVEIKAQGEFVASTKPGEWKGKYELNHIVSCKFFNPV